MNIFVYKFRWSISFQNCYLRHDLVRNTSWIIFLESEGGSGFARRVAPCRIERVEMNNNSRRPKVYIIYLSIKYYAFQAETTVLHYNTLGICRSIMPLLWSWTRRRGQNDSAVVAREFKNKHRRPEIEKKTRNFTLCDCS